jgi:hypothetical protein
MTGYPEEQLYEEIAFVAYYMHWSEESILQMPHWERRKWCSHISKINREVSSETQSTREVSIFDIG